MRVWISFGVNEGHSLDDTLHGVTPRFVFLFPSVELGVESVPFSTARRNTLTNIARPVGEVDMEFVVVISTLIFPIYCSYRKQVRVLTCWSWYRSLDLVLLSVINAANAHQRERERFNDLQLTVLIIVTRNRIVYFFFLERWQDARSTWTDKNDFAI